MVTNNPDSNNCDIEKYIQKSKEINNIGYGLIIIGGIMISLGI